MLFGSRAPVWWRMFEAVCSLSLRWLLLLLLLLSCLLISRTFSSGNQNFCFMVLWLRIDMNENFNSTSGCRRTTLRSEPQLLFILFTFYEMFHLFLAWMQQQVTSFSTLAWTTVSLLRWLASPLSATPPLIISTAATLKNPMGLERCIGKITTTGSLFLTGSIYDLNQKILLPEGKGPFCCVLTLIVRRCSEN